MAVAARSVDAKEISISNVLPRYNVSGEIMDAVRCPAMCVGEKSNGREEELT